MKSIIVWGTGAVSKSTFENCKLLENYNILAVVDNDEKKVGKFFNNYLVIDPKKLAEYNGLFDSIVILTDSYEEIKKQIICKEICDESYIANRYFFYKMNLLSKYENTENTEIRQIIKFLKNNELSIFNYEFIKNYNEKTVQVFCDEYEKMYFVIHNGKKMYFSSDYTDEYSVRKYYTSLLIENDKNSPHRYEDDYVFVDRGEIVVDCGSAEGIFALNVIDIAKKIYIIEADSKWCRALSLTFRDYSNKVEIINGYISSYDDGINIRLDSVIKEKVNFIKMDIEGAEIDGLKGANELIKMSDNLKLSICSYHNIYDQTNIEKYMDANNINHYVSDGYMWFPYHINNSGEDNDFVRGIVRGVK